MGACDDATTGQSAADATRNLPPSTAKVVVEWQVLEILWPSKTGRVREVAEQLPRERSYTTVMTILDRLFQKGLLSRARADRKFLYSTRVSAQEFERRSAEYILSRLLLILSSSGTPEVIMGQLVEGLGRHDAELF